MDEDKVTIKDEICTVEDSIKVVIEDKEESSENRGIIEYFTNINIYEGSRAPRVYLGFNFILLLNQRLFLFNCLI